jgi:hypothetical protein
MKKITLFILMAMLSASISFAQAPPIIKQGVPKKIDKPPVAEKQKTEKKCDKKCGKGKCVMGNVVNLLSAATSKPTPLSKNDAVSMAKRGEILAVSDGKKLYIVVNPDGTSASMKIAEKAGEKICVAGKIISKSGVNIIIQNKIE